MTASPDEGVCAAWQFNGLRKAQRVAASVGCAILAPTRDIRLPRERANTLAADGDAVRTNSGNLEHVKTPSSARAVEVRMERLTLDGAYKRLDLSLRYCHPYGANHAVAECVEVRTGIGDSARAWILLVRIAGDPRDWRATLTYGAHVMSPYAPASTIAVRSLGCAFALVWTFACGGKNADAETTGQVGQSGSSAASAAGSGGSPAATPAAVSGSGAAGPLPAGQSSAGSTAGGALSGSGGSAAGVAGASGAGGAPIPGAPAGAAIDALKAHLAMPRAQRPALEMQAFAKTPLSRAEADQARELLWNDFAAEVRETRMAEMGATESRAASVQVAGKAMRYYAATRGAEPAGGRSLFISMHGGGNAPAATNDSQWQNQIALCDQYMPKDAIWIAPRAPSNDWNMWFTPDVDGFFARLVTNFIVFEGIDPNKVYINGYSAGGDAVYQLGPRMADHWAGAAMSAGHPNDASPLNLRNLPFAIHVGGNDTAYDRNLKAMEWGKKLEELRAADPDGYLNQWQVHAGKPHWMDLEDRVAIPFVQMQTRNPVPSKVVWQQADVLHPRFYWLAVDPASVMKGALVRATYANAVITFEEVSGVSKITVRVSDAMSNLDQPLRVMRAGMELFSGQVPRTIGVLARTLSERGDPAMMFDGEISVTLN